MFGLFEFGNEDYDDADDDKLYFVRQKGGLGWKLKKTIEIMIFITPWW